jgi:hypothetical protein
MIIFGRTSTVRGLELKTGNNMTCPPYAKTLNPKRDQKQPRDFLFIISTCMTSCILKLTEREYSSIFLLILFNLFVGAPVIERLIVFTGFCWAIPFAIGALTTRLFISSRDSPVDP